MESLRLLRFQNATGWSPRVSSALRMPQVGQLRGGAGLESLRLLRFGCYRQGRVEEAPGWSSCVSSAALLPSPRDPRGGGVLEIGPLPVLFTCREGREERYAAPMCGPSSPFSPPESRMGLGALGRRDQGHDYHPRTFAPAAYGLPPKNGLKVGLATGQSTS